MSKDKKPGFFKRLLGSLLGSKEKAPEKEVREEKPKAKPKAPAKKPAAKKPAAKTKKAPVKKAAEKKPAAKKPAAKKPAKARAAKKPALETTAPVKEIVEAPAPEPEVESEPVKKKGWFSRLREGLSKTSSKLTENITAIFTKRKLDSEMLQELEDALIQADLGVDMAIRITEEVARGRYDTEIAPEEVRAVLGAEVAKVLEPMARPLELDSANRPHVILVVGVNGTGKTTTIGKLSHQFAQARKSVVIAAGDTFRAAAIDQLQIWGDRTGAPVVSGKEGADAAGLAYDALEQARERDADVLLIDTAGRLQNKTDLMEELAKIVRVVKKLDESAPHSVLLVLDATTGQNAVSQAQAFKEIAGVTGIIMTKLDGTARGGILVAIAEKFALPIHAIGVGETVEDLQPFDAYDFASAIAGAAEQVEA
ncbi:MAG: signal recognition particle-docking protein FtsY [Hyphomicrobiaceae bacterium]